MRNLMLSTLFVSAFATSSYAEDYPEKPKCEAAIKLIKDNSEVCKKENMALRSPMANCTDKVKARSVFSAERTCTDALAKAGKTPTKPTEKPAEKPTEKDKPADKPKPAEKAKRKRDRDRDK